jgi:lipopolysaccharide transport system ATP-binding protein
MSEIAIRVEGLGKMYRLGATQQSYYSLRDTLSGIVQVPLQAAGRLMGRGPSTATQPRDFWALKDVSFEVKKGESLGIIGRNGAGKSTLLKLLSEITEPTTGRISIDGRVASLLEVGTGFHPELSGRENIFLNGAILGMTKAEIKSKFDEIVAFAEVEQFIDTQVKHYSSGMYLRLAFAVAAHLEPEILVVDEVLAVGDSEFQKKCLGKMGDVARTGRTILFVSHNMNAISQLTNKCLVLAGGYTSFNGPTSSAIQAYESGLEQGSGTAEYVADTEKAPVNGLARARIHTSELNGKHSWGQPIIFEFVLRVISPQERLCFSFQVMNRLQQPVCHFWLYDGDLPFRAAAGEFLLRCEVPKLRLYMGDYTLTTYVSERRGKTELERLSGICPFEVSMQGIYRSEYDWQHDDCAYLEECSWSKIERLGQPL